MRTILFSEIRNTPDLAKNLYCSENELMKFANSTNQIQFYKKMNIPKKNSRNFGQYRTVYMAINYALSLIHKNLETAINLSENFPPYVHGFVRKRSIVTNAKKHLAKKFILNVDIENFFESIKVETVVDAFLYLGCNNEIAEILAKICTLNGFLAQGLSTSPVLANIACREMDQYLFNLSKLYQCEFTRYADDITFSGDGDTPSKVSIEEIFNKYGFKLNHKKYKIQKRGQGQYVTGLTVFDKEYPRLPKKIKKNLRLVLYFANKYGFENHLKQNNIDPEDSDVILEQINKIEGWIKFMFCVEPKLAHKFNVLWTTIIMEYNKGEERQRIVELPPEKLKKGPIFPPIKL